MTMRGAKKDAVYRLEGITKTYVMGEVEVHALRSVDFELRRGELLVLLGASGSGKSTLLNILGGLDTPSTGSMFYEDQDLSAPDRVRLTEFRRAHVGFVFQFYNLIPSLTALENVKLVTDIAPGGMDPAAALELVGLSERINHFPAQMSGGEQQRVAIARAVAKQPSVLLCDEPTGALDVSTGQIVLDALLQVNRTLGTAAAIITHNAAIGAVANRVVRIADGQIASVEENTHPLLPTEVDW